MVKGKLPALKKATRYGFGLSILSRFSVQIVSVRGKKCETFWKPNWFVFS